MKLDHDWIQAHIPHTGNMCLLDAVSTWSVNEICCRAVSHSQPDHPLRNADGLPILVGIEYCAQAMAVHASLLAPPSGAPQLGYLTSVRNVQWSTARLDDVGGEITVLATRISGNTASLLYDFEVRHDERQLLRGRASVLVQVAAEHHFPGAAQ